jgi:hypothetical protein
LVAKTTMGEREDSRALKGEGEREGGREGGREVNR